MIVLSGKQAYVLENLERVVPHPYKVDVRDPVRRYKLDGWECTAQIAGLVVKKLVCEQSGSPVRILERGYSVRGCDVTIKCA